MVVLDRKMRELIFWAVFLAIAAGAIWLILRLH